MASINVGKTTAFLDDIFEAISGGKKVSEELIKEARKYNFNSAVQMAEAHNKGEKISATAAATEKALAKKDKVAETGELKAKESAAIAAQNEAKRDARNQYLMDKVDKGKSADITAEMDEKLQTDTDVFIAGLAQDINKLEAAEKAAAEKAAAKKTKQPKLVKDLTEKGGSPVEAAKPAEAPAPSVSAAPTKNTSPTAELDATIEDVQDKLADELDAEKVIAYQKQLKELQTQRAKVAEKAPATVKAETPADKTKTTVTPAPTPAAPTPPPAPEAKSLSTVKETVTEDTKKFRKPENVYLPQSRVNEGRLNTTETQGVARGSADVATYNPKTKKWEQTGVANQAETPNLPAVIDKNQINIAAKRAKNPDLVTTDNYSSTGRPDTATKEAIARGAITEMSFNYETGRFEPLKIREQAGLKNPPAVVTKPGEAVPVGQPKVEAGPVRQSDGSGLPVPRGETGYTIKEKTQFVDRSQKLLPPAQIDQLEDEMIRAKQGGTEALKVFMDKIKEKGIALTAIGSGAAGILLGRAGGEQPTKQPTEKDPFAEVKPHLTAQEFSDYKNLSGQKNTIARQIEEQQKKFADAQSKVTPNYYTNYNKQAADAKKNIENLGKQLAGVTEKLSEIEKGIPENILYPETIKKIQNDAQISGDFKATAEPAKEQKPAGFRLDELHKQKEEMRKQIEDNKTDPKVREILKQRLPEVERQYQERLKQLAAPTAEEPTKPAAEVPVKAISAPTKKSEKLFAGENPSDLKSFYDKIREQATPLAELDEVTRKRLEGLEENLNKKISDAQTIYEQTVGQARTEADKREAIIAWAGIGEQLGQALIQYFAAREGQRLGARIGSELKLEKRDWAGDLDRSLKKMESQIAGAKEKYGIVSKEVEAGREALGKERTRLEDRAVKQADTFIKAALDEREQRREEQSRMRLKAQDLALAQVQNAAKLNQAMQIQQMKMDLSKENLKTKLSTKQNAEIDKVGKSRTESTQLFFALYDAKKDKRGAAAKAFADASADLMLTQEENAQLDNLSKGPNIGRKGLMPTYTSDEENKATAAAILQRAEIRRINQLSGGQFNVVGGAEEGEAPATQTPGQASLKVGDIRKGHRYKGGNPAEATSWEAVP